MAIADTGFDEVPTAATGRAGSGVQRPPRDLQRTFQLLLATVWLLDAVLQLQPFMFTRGSDGFSGMLHEAAAGNPGWVAHSINWNGSIVYHQPILTNAAFASIQFLIAFGIVWRRTTAYALGLSIVWALGVWWFGEGAGGVFLGSATPFGGGPGGVLYYAVLAVLLWPGGESDEPFVAARTVGVRPAKIMWAAVWGAVAVFSLVGSGRSPQALRDLVIGTDVGQPGWLAHIDRLSGSLFWHHGSAVAVLLALVCVVVAAGVFLPPRFTRMTVVLAVVVFAAIWVAVQDFGGILAGGATDPNSGVPVMLFAIAYWPLADRGSVPSGPPAVPRPRTTVA